MNIFLYTIIFIIGTFFGSFFTLAVYRLPRKEDILIKHSYCPNCNHKLGFFDLFPILSYVILGGKCRYCKTKIRSRYLILEVLTGLIFLVSAIAFKIDVYNIKSIINIAFLLIYVSILFIVAGIDKENVKIQKSPIVFGFFVEIIYIIYLYTVGIYNVYQYVMYLIFLILVLFFSFISLRNSLEEKYYIEILYLTLYMIILGGSTIFIMTVIATLFLIIIRNITSTKSNIKLPIGFYLSISNIFVLISCSVIANIVM